MRDKKKGVTLGIIGASSYGFMPLFTRHAMDAGVGSHGILVGRFLLIFVVMLLWLGVRKEICRPSARQWLELLLYGAGGYGLAIYLLTESYRYIPVGQGTMIHCSYTAFVALYMIVFFREKMTKRKMAALLLTCLSILLLTDFSDTLVINPVGVLLAAVSGAAFAVYMVSIGKSGLKDIDAGNLMLHLSVAVAMVFGLQGVLSGGLTTVPLTGKAVYPIFMISLLSIVGIGFMTLSIRIIGPTYAAMISIFEPVVNLLCSFFILRESVTPLGFLGSLTMLFVLLLIAGEKEQADTAERDEV